MTAQAATTMAAIAIRPEGPKDGPYIAFFAPLRRFMISWDEDHLLEAPDAAAPGGQRGPGLKNADAVVYFQIEWKLNIFYHILHKNPPLETIIFFNGTQSDKKIFFWMRLYTPPAQNACAFRQFKQLKERCGLAAPFL